MRELKKFALIAGGCFFLMAGCARPVAEYSTYVRPDVTFQDFESYVWQEMRPETTIMQAESDLVHRLIVRTIDEELLVRGLEQRPGGDLTVTYRITVSPQKGFWQSLFAAESVTPGTYNLRSAEAQTRSVEEHKLKKGVLVIELRNRDKDIVWSGRVSTVFSEARPGEVVRAVQKIMANYPPYL